MENLKDSKPIFVIGTPRSGTTLTANIIGRHSNVFMPGETHFFEDIYNRRNVDDKKIGRQDLDAALERLFTLYQRYYEPDDQKRVETIYAGQSNFKAAFSNCQTYSEILQKFMNDQMNYEGCVRWGNNAPRDLFSVDDILQFYPAAKFVICVRDIRAFLYSYQGKWKVTGEDHVERLKALYHPVVTSFLWKSSMREVQRLKAIIPPENLLVVKYEDLVGDPENVIRSVCKVIEEEFEIEMLDVDIHNSSNKTARDGIFSDSVDRWKTQLSHEEIAIAQIIGKKELIALGYEQTNIIANKIAVVKYFLGTPFALWRALDANKEVTGPVFPYLFKRIRNLIGI